MSVRMLDTVDRRLVAMLQEDARLSATEIAKRLRLARSTVHERIAKLERTGVILRYSAVVAPEEDEQVVRALIQIDVIQRELSSVIRSLIRLHELQSCHSVNGPADLLCWVEAPHMEDLDALISEISCIPHVTRVSSQIVMATKFDRSPQAFAVTLRPAAKVKLEAVT